MRICKGNPERAAAETGSKREPRPGRKLIEMHKKLVRETRLVRHRIPPLLQHCHHLRAHFLLLLLPLQRGRRITGPLTPRHLRHIHLHTFPAFPCPEHPLVQNSFSLSPSPSSSLSLSLSLSPISLHLLLLSPSLSHSSSSH